MEDYFQECLSLDTEDPKAPPDTWNQSDILLARLSHAPVAPSPSAAGSDLTDPSACGHSDNQTVKLQLVLRQAKNLEDALTLSILMYLVFISITERNHMGRDTVPAVPS